MRQLRPKIIVGGYISHWQMETAAIGVKMRISGGVLFRILNDGFRCVS